MCHMGVSTNNATPQNHPCVHRVFHEIFTIHFGGLPPLFLVQHPYRTAFKRSLKIPLRIGPKSTVKVAGVFQIGHCGDEVVFSTNVTGKLPGKYTP